MNYAVNVAIHTALGEQPVLEGWDARKGDSICMSAQTKGEVQGWLDSLPEGSWAKEYKAMPYYRYPNYSDSLDKIGEAETLLLDHEYERFMLELWKIVASDQPRQACAPIRFERAYLSATAIQRCEAFLRAKGIPFPDEA